MDPVTIIAYLIATAVPAFTVYLFIALDVFGTGKPSTIFLSAIWGATGAYMLAFVINSFAFDVLDRDVVRGFTAPLVEEPLKAAILVYLVQRPRFRYIVDGAVYGIAVGIGFGMSENIFWYIPEAPAGTILGTAITRTLSTALMHGAASGLVGISLGRLRRAKGVSRYTWPVFGIVLAIGLHMLYNNLAGTLTGAALLLVAIGIGIGGGFIIALQIHLGLSDEKKRFAETLGLELDVSTGERKAVQQLGGSSIEQIFGDLNEFFGAESIGKVRRMLAMQANVGILQNNLKSSQVSDRLRNAWEEEIEELQAGIQAIRKELGAPVSLFIQRVFPSDDEAMQQALNEELAQSDPTLVHTFDMFMRVSGLAAAFEPEELAAMAERLHKIDIFSHVSLANLENLSRAIEVHDYPADTVLFEQGDEGNAMYLLEAGEIDIYITDEAGQKNILRTFKPGDVVGEFSLLDGEPRSAGAQAKGDITVLSLGRGVFMQFIQSRPRVVLAMLKYLAEKVRYTTSSVETSVNWMTQIAQGTYEQIVTERELAPAEIALQPEEITSETPELVSGMFSKAAATLHAREETLRAGQASPDGED